MKILAIETSCDETAMCYLEMNTDQENIQVTIRGNITHTQLEHIEYGGVFPAIAKREHQINLPIILEQIMQNQEIPDYICVTSGPGLEPALWCGITFAQELGEKWNIPVIPVNHMEGHILSILVPEKTTEFTIPAELFPLPALALLISGGHTELVSVKNIGDYAIIGKTRDDAVGEAFDKVARILGLPYPGGPEIAKLASQYSTPSPRQERVGVRSEEYPKVDLPRPMLHTPDYDFSFSGLKTATLYLSQDITKEHGTIPDDYKISIAHEFEQAAAEVITKKTMKALIDTGSQTLIIGGGVSANRTITQSLIQKAQEIIPRENIHTPSKELTGDNALMIGLAGYFKIIRDKQKSSDFNYEIRADGNLSL